MANKFEVGQIVKNTSGCSEDRVGMRLKITRVRAGGNTYSTTNLENGHEDFHSEDHLELYEKTFDTLEVGDVIVNLSGECEREVVAVGPKYIATLDKWDKSDDENVFAIESLSDNCKIKQPNVQVELTLEEIADKFKINVKDLRIKKEE